MKGECVFGGMGWWRGVWNKQNFICARMQIKRHWFHPSFQNVLSTSNSQKTAQNSVRMHRWVSLISNFWCPCFWKLLRSSKFKIIVMHLWVCLLSLISLRSANFNNSVLDLIFHSAVLFPEKKFKGRTPTSSFFYIFFYFKWTLFCPRYAPDTNLFLDSMLHYISQSKHTRGVLLLDHIDF